MQEEREGFLQTAHFNPFLRHSDQVIIDLLTDSGTSSMSNEQWAGIMRGDESYAGASSWFRMEKAVQDLTGYPLGNAREVSGICKSNGICFILVACRIGENAWFIEHREPGYEKLTYREIAL